MKTEFNFKTNPNTLQQSYDAKEIDWDVYQHLLTAFSQHDEQPAVSPQYDARTRRDKSGFVKYFVPTSY